MTGGFKWHGRLVRQDQPSLVKVISAGNTASCFTTVTSTAHDPTSWSNVSVVAGAAVASGWPAATLRLNNNNTMIQTRNDGTFIGILLWEK